MTAADISCTQLKASAVCLCLLLTQESCVYMYIYVLPNKAIMFKISTIVSVICEILDTNKQNKIMENVGKQ